MQLPNLTECLLTSCYCQVLTLLTTFLWCFYVSFRIQSHMLVDVEQMFHSFKVKEKFKDFLRFLWYKDKDPNGVITEYRMKVHIFGNTSSPEVANYALRKTAEVGEAKFG